jgi:hypothetical protein
MFHSVPYTDSSKDSLEYYEYNKLGKGASLGCIRLQASDIKWIYDNCKEGTTVTIYDDSDEIPPLDIPKIKKIKKSNPNRYWDPTDPSKKNPWKKLNNKSVKHTNKLSKKIRKSIQTIWDKYDLLGKEKPLWLKNITQ